MKTVAGVEGIVPAEQMTGEDEEESAKLNELLHEARLYLSQFSWCRGIRREFFGLGVGGVVGVFFFDIIVPTGIDSRLWVIVGDLPGAYLVTDLAKTPAAALSVYCDLMSDWVTTVYKDGDLTKVFPVEAQPTKEHARKLEKRIQFLREELIPEFQ